MTNNMGWRRLLTWATIDVLLLIGAGSAIAAPVGPTPSAGVTALPALLMLGVGLCGIPLRRH